MLFPFEAKYIQVRYINKKTVGGIKESQHSLPIKQISNNEFSIDAITYSKIDTGESGQLAIRIIDETIKDTPYFIVGQDVEELISIKDPESDQIWWVENGKWKNYKKGSKKIVYRDSLICRTVGISKLKIGSNECLVKINSLGFSIDQLELYLDDFKDSLSELILSEDTHVYVNAKGKDVKIANIKLLEVLSQFIKFAEKILDHPKRELREKQSVKNYKKVRPIPKTFMEVASRGFAKELTSRDYMESYDVSENRYIYSIVNRIFILLNSLNHITRRKITALKNEGERRKKKLEQFSDYMLISKDSCENYILDLKSRVIKQNEKIEEILNALHIPNNYYLNDGYSKSKNLDVLYIKVTSEPKIHADYGTIEFFGKGKLNIHDEWFYFGEGKSLKYKFDSALLNGKFEFQNYAEYKIIALIRKSDYPTKNGGRIYIRSFDNIYEMSLLCETSTICIQVTSRPKPKDNFIVFWGNVKRNIKDRWQVLKPGESNLFQFDKNIFDGFFNQNDEYEITACIVNDEIINKKTPDKDNKIIHKRYFTKIQSLSIIYSTYQRDVEKYNIEIVHLQNNGWKRILTPDEKKEQDREKESISKILKLIKMSSKENEKVYDGFQRILPRLKKIRLFFIKHKIRNDHHFPGSMTFIQNPHYLGAHKSYKQIKEASGVDEDLFDLWQESEKIGILDIPTIYERWCLLQIIKVLTEKYRFIPVGGDWKSRLLKQIIKNRYDIELLFINNDIGKKARLTYEKEMNNINRRPDFVLDIRSLDNNPTIFHRLIMDAKFRDNVKIPGEVSDLVYELYVDKDYSEDGQNSVYILHPSISAIQKIINPQEWGCNSYYGEDEIDGLDMKRPDHQCGAILVSPFYQNYNSYLDDLQRLIGLYLQYSFEDNNHLKLCGENNNSHKRLDSKPKERIFCLVCGSNNIQQISKRAGINNRKYICTCNNCHHYFVISYCGRCQNRLWKHGRYWTYHKTHAFEPYNIQCPSCGDLIAQRKE